MKRERDTSSAGTVSQRKTFRKKSFRRNSKNLMPPIKLLNAAIDKRMHQTAEKKYFDTSLTYSSVSATYPFDNGDVMIDLSSPAQGTGDLGRIGDEILLNSIEINYLIFSPNAAAQAARFITRVTIFQWAADSTPDISDLVQAGASTVDNLISPWTHDMQGLRKILYNRVITLFDDRAAAVFRVADNDFVEKEFIDYKKKPLKDRRISFIVGSADGYNHIWLQVTSSLDAASQAAGWTLRFKMRINYTDM